MSMIYGYELFEPQQVNIHSHMAYCAMITFHHHKNNVLNTQIMHASFRILHSTYEQFVKLAQCTCSLEWPDQFYQLLIN